MSLLNKIAHRKRCLFQEFFHPDSKTNDEEEIHLYAANKNAKTIERRASSQAQNLINLSPTASLIKQISSPLEPVLTYVKSHPITFIVSLILYSSVNSRMAKVIAATLPVYSVK